MKLKKPSILIGALSVMLISNSAFAQPAHAPAHGSRDNHAHGGQYPHKETQNSRNDRAGSQVDLPRINERELIHLLRQFEAPVAETLPPGIQRQIERGKPLPPGIAKRFDGELASQLPHYPGYEWERAGADVMLVEAATRVVVDIIVDALRR